MFPSPFPVKNLSFMFPAVHITETHMDMATPYNCSFEKAEEDSAITDVMDNVKSFKPELWGLFFLTLLIFMVLIILHYRSNRDTRHGSIGHGFWTVTTFFLKSDALHEINDVSRLISFILCVFMFMVWTCFFENLMSTDLITAKEPFVARTYDDITNRDGHKPKWVTNSDLFTLFENSPRESQAGRLWQKAQKLGIDNCKQEIDVDSPEKLLSAIIEEGKQFKTTVVVNHFGAQVFRLAACILLAKDKICVFRSTDPQESFGNFLGFISTKEFASSDLWLNQMKFFRRSALEANLWTKIFRFVIEQTPQIFGYQGLPEWAMECTSESLVLHTPEQNQLSLWNLQKCFIVCFVMLFIALYILQSEIYHRSYSKKKVSPAQKCPNGPRCRTCAMKTYGHQINPRMRRNLIVPSEEPTTSSSKSWKQIQKEYCKSYYATRKYSTTYWHTEMYR